MMRSRNLDTCHEARITNETSLQTECVANIMNNEGPPERCVDDIGYCVVETSLRVPPGQTMRFGLSKLRTCGQGCVTKMEDACSAPRVDQGEGEACAAAGE